MITLIQLEYVIAVDTYRHFAKAAQKCFVTQPTLSMQIKKLEEQLGVVIFDRSKQPVMPTAIGRKVIEQCRVVLRESEKIPQIIKSFESFVSGKLTIGIIPTLGPYLVPEIISTFIRKYPGVSIHIKEIQSNELINSLKKDLIDVGILTNPISDSSLAVKTLFFEEILIYYNQTQENAASDGKISMQDLDATVFKVHNDGHQLRINTLQLAAYFRNTNGKAFLRYESDSLEALKQLVEKEGGFTFIPEMAAKAITKNGKAQFLHVKEFAPLREIVMVSTQQNTNERLASLLAKHIKETVSPRLLNHNRGKVIG